MYSVASPTAKLSDFSAPKNRILFGERLDAIRTIENSVLHHGLFNPIMVMKEDMRLIVVDGSKRLTALRRLLFKGNLPADLTRVPYNVVDQARKLKAETDSKPLKLLSYQEQYDLITIMHKRGLTCEEIANYLFIKPTCVRDILNVKHLSKTLLAEFIDGRFTLDQARALASLQDHDIQEAIIRVLGPSVSANDILKAASSLFKSLDIKNISTLSLARAKQVDKLAA